MSASLPTQQELEGLFVNNAGLQTIEAFLNRFNPIRVMRMERMEIRHSAILAWLLDPQESHGLDDKFLRAFLGEALRGHEPSLRPTALEVSQADLRDVEVRCEWQHIDIFIYSEANRWAFVIENKFDSSQHEGQLTKYFERVEKYYGSGDETADDEKLRTRGIFLTLYDEEPQDGRYAPCGYDRICAILPGLLKQESNSLASEVSTFIAHYIDILEDALETSDEQTKMERLARQLYRDHRKVLEFVMDHGTTTNFEFAVQDIAGEEPDATKAVKVGETSYHFGDIVNEWIGFLPASWYQALGSGRRTFEGCEDYYLGFPLLAWLELREDATGSGGQVRLLAEVGPITDHAFRKELIEAIQEAADENDLSRIRFQSGSTGENRRYSRFFKNGTLMIRDVQDSDEIARAMKRLLKDFQPEFDAVAEVLPAFLEYSGDAQ